MEKIKFYTKSSISSTPELKMVIDVSGNVGIGESNPTKALEVVGDISFNGDLYQNGTPFQGGTLVNEITDISLNNLNVHGDISANDASFNNVDISNVLNVSNQIIVGDEMDPATAFSNSNQIKIAASDAAPSDYFGRAVAISNKFAIVGSTYNDDYGPDTGSAYIFDVITGNQIHKLMPNDAASEDYFGYSVAISGNYAIVGSPNNNGLEGTAYIFTGTSLFNALNVNGSCLFSGTVTSNGSLLTSDDRVKHNEQPVTNALSTISKLTPKHYFKTKNKLYDSSHNFILDASGNPLDNNHQSLILNKDYTIETGIIAQEIQTIPELDFVVHETIPLGVDYNSIHCTHIAATNELYKLVQTQQQEINNLKQENQTLTQQIQIIQQHLGI